MVRWISWVLRGLAGWTLALLLLFEEWGWEALASLMARVARLPLWAWVERQILRMPAWAALGLFGLPVLALLPLKLLALYWFAHGHAAWGVALLLAAKLLGTALVARLFHLTQPALMRLGWFARWYPRWKAWKDGWLRRIRTSAPWRQGRHLRQSLRRWWDGRG